MKFKKIGSKKINIVIAASAAVVVVGGAGVMAMQNQPKHENTDHVQSAVTEIVPEIKKPAGEEVKPEESVTQPVDQQPTPQPVQTVEEPVAPAPIAYKWSNEMAAAGIAESDYGYITDMLLNDEGWKLIGDKVWQNAAKCWIANKDIVLCLKSAQSWVKEYHGTWAQANAIWNRAGNF